MKTTPSDADILAAGIRRYGREKPLAVVQFRFATAGGELATIHTLAALQPGGCDFQVLCEDYDKRNLLKRITHPFLQGRMGEG